MHDSKALLVELLRNMSDVATTHLPLGGSLIAYKLLLNLYLSQQRGESQTVKSLFATIPFSDMGIRYHLRKLIDAGWLELKPSEIDKRTKVCSPTSKFDRAWAAVLNDIELNLTIQLNQASTPGLSRHPLA
jgi:hypothetical protein